MRLKLQSRLTRRISERLYATVVLIGDTVEHYSCNPFFLSALRYDFADYFGPVDITTFTAQILFCGRSRRHRMALLIVDHLRVNVVDATKYSQARPLLRTRKTAAYPLVNAGASIASRFASHYLPPAPVLPAFLRSTSPV